MWGERGSLGTPGMARGNKREGGSWEMGSVSMLSSERKPGDPGAGQGRGRCPGWRGLWPRWRAGLAMWQGRMARAPCISVPAAASRGTRVTLGEPTCSLAGDAVGALRMAFPQPVSGGCCQRRGWWRQAWGTCPSGTRPHHRSGLTPAARARPSAPQSTGHTQVRGTLVTSWILVLVLPPRWTPASKRLVLGGNAAWCVQLVMSGPGTRSPVILPVTF